MLALWDFRVRQRDFLLEITRAITAQLDLTEVLRRVLNASLVMLAGQIGIVALRDSSGVYHIRATMGIDAARMPMLRERFEAMFVDAPERITYAWLELGLKEMASALDESLRQTFALPLGVAGEPLGLLIVFRSYAGGSTPDDIQILQSFADQAAIAVHNAQLYERMEQERRRLAAIVQHSADGVMILDAQRRVLSFNLALERMTGWTAAEAVGRDVDEVLAWKRVETGDLRRAIDDGTLTHPPDGETVYVEGDLLRRDGLTVSIGVIYAPLLDAEGKLATIIANVRDISNFRQAQAMQNTFISTVSHELKTPVALIKGHAATLRREDVSWDEATIREYAEVIEDEADRLTELIQNLLTASRLQADGRIQLQLDDVRLDHLAARAVERFQSQTRIHSFKLKFPNPFPPILGDEGRLRQVIDNLLSNAIKYSPDGGVIEVGGTSSATSAMLYVRDQGVGLSEADRERVFERFFRVDGALSRKTQGTGLGLYLAKAIIEAHNGKLGVDSQPGKGSKFYFILPRSTDDERMTRPSPA
jgi:PAS domain S-box-containing protein